MKSSINSVRFFLWFLHLCILLSHSSSFLSKGKVIVCLDVDEHDNIMTLSSVTSSEFGKDCQNLESFVSSIGEQDNNTIKKNLVSYQLVHFSRFTNKK